jgi:hypothetical protein
MKNLVYEYEKKKKNRSKKKMNILMNIMNMSIKILDLFNFNKEIFFKNKITPSGLNYKKKYTF